MQKKECLLCWDLPYLKMSWRNFGSTDTLGFPLYRKNGSFVMNPSVDINQIELSQKALIQNAGKKILMEMVV